MTLFVVTSITMAIKGQNLLYKNRISSDIQRVADKKKYGCGYCVTVRHQSEAAEKLLRQSGIRILDVLKA